MSPELRDLRKRAARANRAFYEALGTLDIDRMRDVWLDDPTIKCVHPGGELIIGQDRVMESWKLVFDHSQGVRFEVVDLQLEILGDMAWTNNVERFHIGVQQGVVISEAAATNLFVMRDEGWKMVLHHASPIARRFFEEG